MPNFMPHIRSSPPHFCPNCVLEVRSASADYSSLRESPCPQLPESAQRSAALEFTIVSEVNIVQNTIKSTVLAYFFNEIAQPLSKMIIFAADENLAPAHSAGRNKVQALP